MTTWEPLGEKRLLKNVFQNSIFEQRFQKNDFIKSIFEQRCQKNDFIKSIFEQRFYKVDFRFWKHVKNAISERKKKGIIDRTSLEKYIQTDKKKSLLTIISYYDCFYRLKKVSPWRCHPRCRHLMNKLQSFP